MYRTNDQSNPWLGQIANSALSGDSEVAQQMRTNFVINTCDGCHQNQTGHTPNVEAFYHISHNGKLSEFVQNDSKGRRAQFMSDVLGSQSCNPDSSLSLTRSENAMDRLLRMSPH
jgi:hypothetical protein